jgi:hypothetical protein
MRPLREAAPRAASPMRQDARIDPDYVSDIAETCATDDEDELDADGIEYAPFETQAEESGDNTTSDIPECEDIGTLGDAQHIESHPFANQTMRIPEDGLFPLVQGALQAEQASGSRFGQYFFNEAKEYWTELSLLALCTMPDRVIHELIRGNLKEAYDSDASLRERLDAFQERAKKHPCIYARSLTTADGQPMTISQARRLVKWLQRYVSDDETIQNHPTCKEAFHWIDAEFGGQWKRASPHAERAYLATKSSIRLESRVGNVLLFCQQLLVECDRCESNGIALKPLLYIGYAARADCRKRQHEACGKFANWLATLVQALCNVLWGRGYFKMHFMVICLLAAKSQGIVAEMLLTRITGAYYNVGGGFCIDVAGKSMESLYFKDLTASQNEDAWNDFYQWVEEHTPLLTQSTLQHNRRKAARARREEERRELARPNRERASKVVESLRATQALCETYGDGETRAMMGELWEEAHRMLPDYAWE